jgi:hypothetical protein
MINPYHPPPELRRAPFLRRFRRAGSMAIAEFRRGWKRDGYTGWDLVKAVIGMCAALFIVLCLALWIVLFVLIRAEVL